MTTSFSEELRRSLYLPHAFGMQCMFHNSSDERKTFPFVQFLPPEPPDTFAKSRKRDFLLGRACAAEALFKLGGPVEQALFKVADDRLPIWPKGWIGSISHSSVGAIAIVAKSSFTPVLGIDMHWMRDLPADLSAFRLVARRSEYAVVDRLPLTERCVLVFSAKEALYKALFPIIREVLDFSAARVAAFSLGTITLRLRHDWNHIFRKNREFIVRWSLCRDHVFTICSDHS
ncbi:MAG: 4'-phosphopantetheinyl transferase superfamily protein [Acidihalobacter sp.]|uniref:4'-phosphopantetheinyl transferase family protein n=1 Tax=Acidihalobacter sp. TaxID=1872108 RepID=UPI00307E06F9